MNLLSPDYDFYGGSVREARSQPHATGELAVCGAPTPLMKRAPYDPVGAARNGDMLTRRHGKYRVVNERSGGNSGCRVGVHNLPVKYPDMAIGA